MPSHTSPSDLLSITTFSTEENVTMRKETERYISKGMVATGGDDETENTVKDRIKNDDNEANKLDDSARHSLGKRKLVPAKSLVTDENGVRVKKRRTTTDQHNSDMENQQETPNKDITNCNKITDTDRKRKRKLSINADTFKLEDTGEGAVKRDPLESATKLDKNKMKELAPVDKSYDDNNKKESVSQTAKHPIERDIGATSSNIEEKETGADERKKKKNRKKRNNFQQDITSDMMQVMAKRDWKRLRNKYLELQKTKMQQLKVHLKKARWNYDKAGHNHDRSNHEKDEKSSEVEKSCYGRTAYAPGIIVKIEMDEPCADPQSLKVCFYLAVIVQVSHFCLNNNITFTLDGVERRLCKIHRCDARFLQSVRKMRYSGSCAIICTETLRRKTFDNFK